MTDKKLIRSLRGYSCQEWTIPNKAADRLEALLAENEHLREVMKMVPQWVGVDERLPEPGERVLATDGGFVGEFYISNQGQWKRYNVNHHELLMALDILWWMPFPEPPSTEGVPHEDP